MAKQVVIRTDKDREKARQRITELSMRILDCQIEMLGLKEALKASQPLGQQEGFTIYQTKETRVKGYTRRGFTALRIVPNRKSKF